MTITIGWWALPLLITIGGFVITTTATNDVDLSAAAMLTLIVSLVSWLIWAVLT